MNRSNRSRVKENTKRAWVELWASIHHHRRLQIERRETLKPRFRQRRQAALLIILTIFHIVAKQACFDI